MADLVTAVSNTIPNKTSASYEESRKVSIFVEGSSKKAEYIDGIGFFNGKGYHIKAFPKAVEKRQEYIIYLKVPCTLVGPDIDERDLPRDFQISVLP